MKLRRGSAEGDTDRHTRLKGAFHIVFLRRAPKALGYTFNPLSGKKMLERLQLGPWFFTVKLEADPKDDDGHDLYGHIDTEKREIVLRDDMCAQRFLQTLFHELLHDIDDRFHLELGETGVCIIEDQFASLLVNNPSLVALLQRYAHQTPPTRAHSAEGEAIRGPQGSTP